MEKIKFKKLGVMLDCSRNAVRTVSSIKKFIDILSDMGYNLLQLYTEDTFEITEEKHFGYMRGRYSKEELKELDNYAKSKNIELVPCIQTLAHLNQMFRWEKYKEINDCDDILLCGNEKTYDLIEKMFKSIRECFSSNLVNIGMDEAHMVGLGKYLTQNGFQERYSIILKHLARVNEIAQKYSFKPMMWSDMFFRLANNSSKYYLDEVVKFSDEIINQVPQNLSLIYWDYYQVDENKYDVMMKAHKQFKNDIWFAGGCWIWGTFAPHNKFSLRTIKASFKMAIKNNIENIIMTMWGDNGAECSYYSVLPCLYYASCMAKGITSEKEIKNGFKQKFNIDFDKFLYLDLLDEIYGDLDKIDYVSKRLLYSDLFLGFQDGNVTPEQKQLFKSYSKKLSPLIKDEQYGYIFDSQKALCDVLYIKCDLGYRTRKLYKENDKEKLKDLILEYKLLSKKLNIFYEKFKTLWFKENKPHGFDIQDIRLGGLKQRVISCENRIKDYIDGKINVIEELEEELIDLECNLDRFRSYGKMVSPNIL